MLIDATKTRQEFVDFIWQNIWFWVSYELCPFVNTVAFSYLVLCYGLFASDFFLVDEATK